MRGFGNRRGGMHWGWFVGIGCLVVVIGLCVFFVAAVLPAFNNMKKGAEPLAQCGKNLEAVATAIKTYQTSHGGAYPPKLAALSPAFLKDASVLTCPAAKENKSGYEYTPPTPNAPADWIVVRCHNHSMIGQTIGLIIQKDGQVMTDTRSPINKAARRGKITVETGGAK